MEAKEQRLFRRGFRWRWPFRNQGCDTADITAGAAIKVRANRPIVLYEMIERLDSPYGWPDEEVLLLVARLLVLQEIQLIANSVPLPLDKVYDAVSTSAKWRKVTVLKRKALPPG